MSRLQDLTLQINLAPGDAQVAAHLLPHQVGLFAACVDQILLTVDGVSGGGKFVGRPAHEAALRRVLDDVSEQHDNIRVEHIRYDSAATGAVSQTFFGGRSFGLKDRRGGPCHCYLDALLAVDTRYVFHIDSDMMFAGDPERWLAEAIPMLNDPDIVAVNPLGGPPGNPIEYQSHRNPERTDTGYLFSEMSTRIFLADVDRLIDTLCPLPDAQPYALSERIERWLGGHPDQELPEVLLSRAMVEKEVKRLDMLGSGDGLWALHPVHKTERFVELLPGLLKAIESGDIPEEQRGHYDIQPAFAPLDDLPGLRQKIGHWLSRTPRQSRNSRS